MNKICIVCNQKEITEFNSYCTSCRLLKSKEYYHNHRKEALEEKKEYYKHNKEQILSYSRKRKAKRVEFINSFKVGKACQKCNVTYNPWQMDFDHRNPKTKLDNIAGLKSRKIETILEEISKCDLLCANCHKDKTYINKETKSTRIKKSYHEVHKTPGDRLCLKCNKTKPKTEFHLKRGNCRSVCKVCRSEEARAKIIETNKLINLFKRNPCMDCRGIFPPHIMEFDHIDPTKKSFNIGRSKLKNKQSILCEISKCELVCANCHRQRTHERLISRND